MLRIFYKNDQMRITGIHEEIQSEKTYLQLLWWKDENYLFY